MPRLIVVSGASVGLEHAFERGLVVGREKSAELVLRSPSVSRNHARFEERGGRWYVVDLGSSNGTFVGDERVEESPLDDGQFVRLGDVELRFRLATSSAPAKTASAPPPAPSAPPAPERAPAPASEGEIELEGDWSDAPLPSAPAPERSRPASEPKPRAQPAVAPASARDEARRESLQTAARGGGARATASGGRILQYHRQEQRSGVLTTEFAQQPAWLRYGGLLVVAAAALALAYGAFALTRHLRESHDIPSVEEPGG